MRTICPPSDHSAGAAGSECTFGAGCSDAPMARVRMQRRKADVAAKILKAIGHSKPPKIEPEMRQKFFPLAEELKAEMRRINEKSNLDEITKRSSEEKNIFIAMETGEERGPEYRRTIMYALCNLAILDCRHELAL